MSIVNASHTIAIDVEFEICIQFTVGINRLRVEFKLKEYVATEILGLPSRWAPLQGWTQDL